MTRNRIRLAAATLLSVAAVGVLAAGAFGRGDITVSSPVLVGQVGVIAVNNSPSIARNPRNANNVVVANRVDRPGFSAAVSASTDGGRTWTTTTPPLPDDLDRPFAPSVAFGPDGTLYVTYVNLTGRGNVPETLWVAASRNGGRSFSEPTAITGPHPFQAQLVVDHDTGDLHVTWLQAEELALLAFPGRPVVQAAHSTDGGATWSRPVRVSDPSRQRVGAAVPVVTGDGTLVVVYEDFKGDRRDFGNLEGPPWPEPFALVATRSNDAGETFSEGIELDSDLVALQRFLPFLPPFPGVAAFGDRGIGVTWSDGRNGDLDVFLRTSRDAGGSWSEPVRVNDNPLGDGTSQYLPAMDVAPNGRIDIAYLDRRDDPTDVQTRAALAFSTSGTDFRTLLLSPQAFDSRIGASAAPHLEPDAGSRLGVDSRDDRVITAWADTTLGTTTSGRQDLATRVVTMPTPLIGLPGAVGLAIVLLLVVLATLFVGPQRTRSQDDRTLPPPPDPAPPAKSPAATPRAR